VADYIHTAVDSFVARFLRIEVVFGYRIDCYHNFVDHIVDILAVGFRIVGYIVDFEAGPIGYTDYHRSFVVGECFRTVRYLP
jgi:hypothetical protein